MEQPNGRLVSVHLTHLGDYLGLIGPFDVDVEWWSVVAPVTARLEAGLGVPVGVLRLVSVSGGEGGSGGHTVYHAEALARPEGPAPGGLPNTLVHGDFHPGNWRFDGQRTVLVDFADSCYGHPALDGLRPRGFVSGERWKQIADTWTRAWSAHAPGSDPARALALAEPLAHLSYAVRYQEFLDHIEPSERVYHEGDPAAELRAALAAVQEPACD